jgi:uncharacterized protein (TIGR03118 family)
MKGIALRRLSLALALALCVPGFSFAQHYTQTNLVTDGNTPGVTAAHTDGQLLNPWGITRSTGSPWWVSDNNAGVSTLYDGTGTKQGLVVTIPGPKNSPPNFVAAPTGVIFNGSSDFAVTPGHPAHFIFCTEDGTVSAWPGGSSVATLEVDNSQTPNAQNGAVYKGCTSGDVNGTRYLYLANFRSGQIEVYDATFTRVHLHPDHDASWRGRDADERDSDGGAFQDERIPRGFAPHNIQNIGGSLIVAYAKQDPPRHDAVKDGGGFVDIFSPSGRLEARLQDGPWFQAPWGAVWTPRDFGELSNRLLIGNFGSGTIAAFDGFDGHFIGFMLDPDGKVIVNDGLWSLTFGNSADGCTDPNACGSAGPYNSLFFTAGVNDEAGGLFGTFTAIKAEQDGDEE